MKIGNKELLAGAVIAFLMFFFVFFKLAGLRLILGFAILFVLPIYLILSSFKLDSLEKIAYSFFLGIGVVPTLVYYLGIIISLRAAMVLVFIVLVVISIVLRKLPKKKLLKSSS